VIFTSAFYGAVGIWPSRDNIQTIADPNAFEDTLIANLLGGFNTARSQNLVSVISICCGTPIARETNSSLKPDRPIVPI